MGGWGHDLREDQCHHRSRRGRRRAGLRFAARLGSVEGEDGFEGFELLRPTDGRSTWLVVTRWRDEAAYEAWLSSDAFAAAHARAGAADGERRGPVGTASELWAFDVVRGA